MTDLSPVARHHAFDAVWRAPRGWRSIFSVNHTTVGLRFIGTALVFFLIGGVLAMLIRAQLATPGNDFLDSETYNQIFTMHGTVMMFLFAIPMLEGFAIYLLPKMLGSRDLAYPRLGAFAYWCYLFGGLILIAGLVSGVAPNTGWFMYTPLSSQPYSPGINADLWLIGVTFSEISAVCGAVELVATILRLRAPGMSLRQMPLFAWYMLVTGGMILVGFPPLILGSILLELERALNWPFFDVARGGDPLLWQHLFWMFGHPEVYIIFLPAAGMVSTMIPTFAQRRAVAYPWIVASIVAMGFISFGLWVHHMFTVGIAHLAAVFFSAASMLVALPTAVQFFAWIATLWAGKPVMRLPMLYLFGFLAVFVAGGLTGVMLALVPFNWQAHDTHFVVAHLHYVLVGGMVFPLLAATYYWMPHVTGRMPSEHLGKWAFWLIFIGFNLTFFFMHLTGLLGMPRRVYTYQADAGWDWLNLLSSIGGFLQAIGFGIFVLDVLLHARIGRAATRNPWGAGTLEWAMPTPSPTYNIASIPKVDGPDPLWQDPTLGARLAAGEGYLPQPTEGRRETIGIEPLTGRPQSIVFLPGPSKWPLAAAIATGGVFLAILFKVYLALPFAGVLLLAILLGWGWHNGLRSDPQPVDAGHGLMLMPHAATDNAPGWYGLVYALIANGACFASLVFGYVYLWTIAPNWPPPSLIAGDAFTPAVAVAGLLVATLATRHARHANQRLPASRVATWLGCAAIAGVAATLSFADILFNALPPATSHAYASTTSALAAYGLLHAGMGTVWALFAALRCLRGYVSALRRLDVDLVNLWWTYTASTGGVILAALYLLPGALA